MSDPDEERPEARGDERGEWLVDGYNVLRTVLRESEVPERWWSSAERDRLVALASSLARAQVDRLWIVFDGSEPSRHAPADVELVFAPSADAWIRRRVASAPVPERVRVVSRDRKVADRARHKGARVVDPSEFVARCRAACVAGDAPDNRESAKDDS